METGWQFVFTLPRSFEDSFAGQVWLQKDDDGTWSSNGSSPFSFRTDSIPVHRLAGPSNSRS
jgi:hypothetical protein